MATDQECIGWIITLVQASLRGLVEEYQNTKPDVGESTDPLPVMDNRVLIVIDEGTIEAIYTDMDLKIIRVETDKGILNPLENQMVELSDGDWAWIQELDTDPLYEEFENEWTEYEDIIEGGD